MTPFWLTAFLDFAPDVSDRGVRFWQAATGYALSSARGDRGEFATLLPPDGDDFLRVQRLGQGPSRIHLDLHVRDPRAAAEDAVALGARVTARPEGGYVVLESPGGLAFCLVHHQASDRPAPSTWPGGHSSLVDQVCLDLPSNRHDAEIGFWCDLTGWELVHSPVADEFHSLVRPPGIPLRLLLQRLGDADGPVWAHLDVATGDRAAETGRHRGLGATVVQEHELWTVLTDPAGSTYCLTDRDPETGMLLRAPAH
jgi:hypothetical protein